MTSIHPLLFSLLFLLPLLAFAQNYNNISIGSSLSANDEASSWPSPSGDFAFGFCQLDNKAFFLLCIRFDKIPEKTIVWYANGDSPAPRGSKVELTANNGLVLTDPEGIEIWSSQLSNTVAYGAMLNTGNFVLASGNSTNLWESFKNQTDTMLPTQVLQRDGALYSRQSESNFTRGRFQLLLYQDGSLQLNVVRPYGVKVANYYGSDTSNASNLVFDESGYMYMHIISGERFDLTPARVVPAIDFYYRATVNYDGVFTLYSHPKTSNGNASWSPVWTIPNNICIDMDTKYDSPVCGYNSICKLNSNQRPSCECPPGYSIVDPNDSSSGCMPNFTLCGEHGVVVVEELYQFANLSNIDWPNSDYQWTNVLNKDDCGNFCLHDCLCAAAFFKGDDCYKYGLPLKNGRVDPTKESQVLVKVAKFSSPTCDHARPIAGRTKLIGSVLIGGSALFNIVLVGTIIVIIFLRNSHNKLTRPNQDKRDWVMPSFPYKYLEKATHGFTEELGSGSSGIVYKGAIKFSACPVAVKKLEKMDENGENEIKAEVNVSTCPVAVEKLEKMGENGENEFKAEVNVSTCPVAVKKLKKMDENGENEFKAEVNVMGQTNHKHIVRLLGFCEEGKQRLLVYEFMSNGTLASFLFNERSPNWDRRVQIAIGIARGILYLHEECCSKIIHCDLKPQNILLDDNYVPKISDFGQATVLLINQSETLTTIRGTRGYLAPEWSKQDTPINMKVDVYSFGVILLEIICCRRSIDEQLSAEKKILLNWAWDRYEEGNIDALVENDRYEEGNIDALVENDRYEEGNIDALVENDEEAIIDMMRLKRLVMIAMWCIQEPPSRRPTMREVVQMIEGAKEVTEPPCPSLEEATEDTAPPCPSLEEATEDDTAPLCPSL